MIEAQDWLAPLLGTVFLMAVLLFVALMCNTIVRKMRSDDLRAHEYRLDRRTLPNRKDDERARLKVGEQWARIEGYTRGRNLSLLIALAVVEVNAALIMLALAGRSPALSLSLLAVLVLAFVAAVRLALKKPTRPIWATTPGYYRDLATGGSGKKTEESA